MTTWLIRDSATWPVGTRAAGEARRLVRTVCLAAEVDDLVCDTAVLLTSELISNASIHARSPVRLAVAITGTRLRAEVSDDNPAHPRRRSPDLDAVNGRGIALVDAYAHRWGVVDEVIGKTVWFELDLPPHERSSSD